MPSVDFDMTDEIQLAKVHKRMQTFLPEEIITNILARLPSRSIARLQCVCKQWRSSIYDPYFINERRNKSLNKIRIVNKEISGNQLDFYDFNRESTKIHRRSSNINLGRSPLLHYHLSNILHGLTCAYGLTKTSDMHLLNLDKFEPQKFKLPTYHHCELPEIFDSSISWGVVSMAVSHRCECRGISVGLSFDPLKGVYKVVRLCNQGGINFGCEILSAGHSDEFDIKELSGLLDDGKCRQIGKAPALNCEHRPVFLHGALHWKPRDEPNIDPLALIKFDVSAEKFELMEPMPHNCSPSTFIGFDELENTICSLFCTAASIMEVWVLKNYKKHEWSKIHNINMNSIMQFYSSPHLVGIADGTIMLKLYGLDTKDTKKSTVHCFDIRDEVYHNLLCSNSSL